MVGVILGQEMLLGGRRNRLHVFRWLYAGWLVAMVFWLFFQFQMEEMAVAMNRRWGGEIGDLHASGPQVVGGRFAAAFAWQQVLFLFLATPVFTAGAIIDEKRRGTLDYLLLGEIEVRHLLVGKLLGRLAQVTLWLMAGWPLFALLAGFGGVEPVTLVLLFLGLIPPAVSLTALSLLASAECRQTRDAVLLVYALTLAGYVAVHALGGPLLYLDPQWILQPAWGAGAGIDLREAARRLAAAAVVWAGVAVLALAVATWRLVPNYLREMDGGGAGRRRWFAAEREPVDDDPVGWREQHVEGLAPNPTLRRVPRWLGVAAVAGLSTASSLLILWASLAPGATAIDLMEAILQLNVHRLATLMPEADRLFLDQGVVVMLLGSLVVGVRCAGAITLERERQTWEALLLTPISAKQIARGKLWGIMRATSWYLLAYAAPAMSLSVLGGFLSLVYTVAYLGATVLAMYFIGAAGLWCSVRAKTSFRSLLQTMAVGYLGGLAVYAVTTPVILVVAVLLLLLLLLLDAILKTNFAGVGLGNFTAFAQTFRIGSAIGLVLAFWLLARWFLRGVQRWIADRDRTRYWHDEPLYRRSRPRLDPADEGPRQSGRE